MAMAPPVAAARRFEIGAAAWMIEPARAIARTLSARGQPQVWPLKPGIGR